MFQKYGDRVGFLFVYIREAHPADEWQMPANEEEGVVLDQPRTQPQRDEAAANCCASLKLTMPCVVDTVDNKVDALYAGWPERMFVIDNQGKIACAGKHGPWGFKPQEVEGWLRQNMAR